ncbi:nickel import ATP-binding protein NikE [Consotaella salsifontis]|uniref:Nickel import ATP-binding protein NikE n=1 Tax=Consotaella salsifontis TaxID=1365950 RepID=A0A1T4P5Q0_9HYPH|nr:nickel import ATP-binding protein NikE [Consotaella salsifontis]SJZ86895.1 nickel transport system ATP-binding protein [Consotaella salsifontis]
MSLLQAEALTRRYRTHSLVGAGVARTALEDVSLSIAEGETVALLGRSGCGKSTLARLLAGLEKPDAGKVSYRGTPLSMLDRPARRAFRRDIQMVFQDSPSAVNPRFTVSAIIGEPLRHLTELDAAEREARVSELLEMVELPASIATRLPSQISGGQLQRVCIARALAAGPKLIILDEAVSNLDIHLQTAALDLLSQLQRSEAIAYLFVTHDLRLVERFAARALVMDEGRIVEEAGADGLAGLKHPASLLLRQAVLPALPRRMAEHAKVQPASTNKADALDPV